jgi:glycosyltransferase involved in cell wall biosynthesis
VIEAADNKEDARRLGANGRAYVKKHFDTDLVIADLVEKMSTL